MSIDQAMLEQTAIDLIPRMRVYRWLQPTVSLGYFQKLAEFQDFESTQGLPVVRRATGGGAIVHDFDWTYSIALPSSVVGAKIAGASSPLYDCVHRATIAWLSKFEIASELWSDAMQPASCAVAGCSFLCFERRHAGDVVCQGVKIMGSAQRRLGAAILQHGSLLLKTSPFAPSLAGLVELSSNFIFDDNELDEFSMSLVKGVANEFSIGFRYTDWLVDMLPIDGRILDKFDSLKWTGRI